MRAFRTLLIGLAALGAAGQARAQTMGDAVAATVNDVPISTFDVQQRVRLMLVTTGGQIPQGAELQYQQEALRELIEEELKRQETVEFQVETPESEVDQELARIAATGNTTINALANDLRSAGIAIEKLREKIRVDNAWQTLVRGRFNARVSVSDEEIDDMLAEMRAEQTQEQILLSEICLPVEGPQQRDRVYNVGMQMLQQMQEGVPFQVFAQQFSVCPSAARGGDLGWMRAAELEDEVEEVVNQLSEGNVSTPIEMEDGTLKLVALRGMRAAAEKGDPSFELAYASVPRTTYPREEAARRLGLLPTTNACNGEALSTDLGEDIGVELFPMVPITAVREDFHDDILGLRRGDLSEVMESSQHYHRVYVCEMDEGLGLPRRRQVESRLEAEQFNLLSRRYLRDIERDSDIDIRMFEEEAQQDS